jgi:hypothetical protein
MGSIRSKLVTFVAVATAAVSGAAIAGAATSGTTSSSTAANHATRHSDRSAGSAPARCSYRVIAAPYADPRPLSCARTAKALPHLALALGRQQLRHFGPAS